MRTLLLSTALVAAGAFSATAQTADATLFQSQADASALRASEVIGMRVYNSQTPLEGDAVAGVGDDWDDLGEISDVILTRDGMVQAVLVDLGGFLGVGERQVAVNMGALRIVSDDATGDIANDFFLVMNAPREALDQAPAYTVEEMGNAVGDAATGAVAGATAGVAAAGTAVADGVEATGDTVAEGADAAADAVTGDAAIGGTSDQQPVVEGGTSDQQPVVEGGTSDAVTDGSAEAVGTDAPAAAEGQTATEGEAMAEGAEATTSTTGADAEAQMTRQPIEREGFAAAPAEAMTAEALTGARVYDANDEWIGDVSELMLTADGQIDQAVIDVGGFLGIGEKPVAVPLADMDILQQSDGTEVRVFLQRTKEELEALPTHEG